MFTVLYSTRDLRSLALHVFLCVFSLQKKYWLLPVEENCSNSSLALLSVCSQNFSATPGRGMYPILAIRFLHTTVYSLFIIFVLRYSGECTEKIVRCPLSTLSLTVNIRRFINDNSLFCNDIGSVNKYLVKKVSLET